MHGPLAGRDWLVGDAFSIADLSVFPRVAMYPLVKLAIDPSRYANLGRWMTRVAGRPSMRHSERVQPD